MREFSLVLKSLFQLTFPFVFVMYDFNYNFNSLLATAFLKNKEKTTKTYKAKVIHNNNLYNSNYYIILYNNKDYYISNYYK